jgi:colanic acid/amylovoran biosynthesis glycosyltransferase
LKPKVMRVLHFAESFSLLSETFIYDYVTELERQGVDNHVVTLNRQNEEARPFPKVYEVDAPDRWHPLRLWHRLRLRNERKPSRVSFWPQLRNRIADVVSTVRPDVIHAHFGPAGVRVAPAAEHMGVPLVITLYGYDVSRLARKEFWTEKYPSTFERASLLIGISNHICSRIQELGGAPKKIKRWHLGIDLDQFEYRPADDTFDGQTVRCLHVGRLVEKKSPVDLVRAFKNAQERVDESLSLSLKIAGDGPLRAALEDEVKSLKLEEDVSLLGAVPHSRVSELLMEANIYTQHCKTASDGDQEGQGVTFVEASASGLPIVSTRHNGLPDVIKHGETGYLVEEGDTEEMGKMIAMIAERPEEWNSLGRAGRRHIEENFRLKEQAIKMKETFSKFL